METGQENKSANNTKRYAVIAVIVLALGAVITFLAIQNSTLEEEKAQKELALDKAFLELDSISNELDDRILTISQLGGEIDTLLSIKTQLEEEKKIFLDREKRTKLTVRDLRDKVEGYQELLVIKDEEIKQLTEINTVLMSENSDLKIETQELTNTIRETNREKEELNKKIELVAQLKVEGMAISAVAPGGKERLSEFRNRHIEQIKIQFTVSENKVAPIEGKELLIKVTDPNGEVLFDVTRGSGTFIFEGRELFFTSKKEILYDRSSQQVTVFYDKGSEYILGIHQVEIYTDEYLMGTGSFVIKG